MPQAAVMLAHAKWFVDWSLPFPTDWRFMLDPASIAMIVAVIALTGAWIVADRRVGVLDLPSHRWLARLQPALPRLAAASLGLSLVALTVTGSFLAPHLSVRGAWWGIALLQGLVGVWLITGIQLRQAAAALGMLAAAGLVLLGPVAVLEAAHMWGIAWFLGTTVGLDGTVPRSLADGRWQTGLLGLRLGVGGALAAGAMSEKLMNPALFTAILEAYPVMNLPQMVGLSLDTATVTRLAGSVELLLGLLIIAGVTPRLVALITAGPFLVTVPLFGHTELFGHLPIYGALLVLLVCAPAGQQLPAAGARQPARRQPQSSDAAPSSPGVASEEPPVPAHSGSRLGS